MPRSSIDLPFLPPSFPFLLSLQRRHVAAVLIQKVFRGHVGRKRMQHRRSCSFTLIRLGKLLILKQNMRRWGRVRLLHLRVAPRPFQREYRRHRARLALAAQVTKGLRLMNLALLFWVINVNLKYLWGRTMIEKNRMIVRRVSFSAAGYSL